MKSTIERFTAWLEGHKRVLGWIWTAIILAVIARELWKIGLAPLAQDFPNEIWFFVLFAAGFMAVPVSERIIFRRIWPSSLRASWYSLLRKRTLNAVVMGHSGDVWFANWARERMGVEPGEAFHGVKDATILSGLASGTFTLFVVGLVLALGQHDLLERVLDHNWAPIGVMVGMAAIAVPLLLRFRRTVFRAGLRTGGEVFGLHLARLFTVNTLQVLQYVVVLPFVPLETWLLFIAAQLLVQQLPLIPNRELLFLAVAVQLTHEVGVDQAALAALLVATTLLRQIGNVVVLIGTTLLAAGNDGTRKEGAVPASVEAQPAE